MKPHLQSAVFTLIERQTSQREIQRLTGIDRRRSARQHRLVSFHAVRAKQTLGDRIERQIVLIAPQFREPIPVRPQHGTPVPPVGKGVVRCVTSNALTQRIALAIPTRKIRAALVPRKTVLNNSLDHPNPKRLHAPSLPASSRPQG
ncbi:hypothetical protein [Bradyrhizobium hipponense]|uniref:hypothetical protein n=1 Tax=Bradyrhizobium hipponense TaxID=2605638 RepID=UPI001652D8B1|nr:hypothetical protein [Bradyrhizobium hipponense]